VSAEPLAGDRLPPPTPHPAGVVDLARYRGRIPPSGVTPAVRPDGEGAIAVPVEAPPAAPAADALPVEEGEVVIRRVRLGSVFKMTFGFTLCAYLVVIGAGVLIWQTITTIGVVENVESLVEDLGWDDVRFDGDAMLRSALVGGGILVVAATFLSVVFGEVFNLLSTMTGGLRAEVGPPPPSRRERRRARKVAKAAAGGRPVRRRGRR
jgi:hypothetical protein